MLVEKAYQKALEVLKKKFGAKVVAHKDCREYLEGKKVLYPKGVSGIFIRMLKPFFKIGK